MYQPLSFSLGRSSNSVSKVNGLSATGCGEDKMIGQLSNDQINLPTHLIIWVIVLFQVRVCKGLFYCDPAVRVEGQHLIQQVQGWETKGVKPWELA